MAVVDQTIPSQTTVSKVTLDFLRVISLKDKNVAVVSGFKIPVEVGHKTKSRLEVFLGSK